MATGKLRVKVNRSFNRYTAGDELLLPDDGGTRAEIAATLLTVLEELPAPEPKPKAPPKKADD